MDRVSLVTHMVEAIGLPVVGVGLPGRFGSLCPLCRHGLAVVFADAAVAFECTYGCDEPEIFAALAGGAA